MEADFMAHLAQLVINTLRLGFLVSIMSCNANETIKNTPPNIVNADTANTSIRNGVLYQYETIFSGTIVSFYTATNDTAEISSYINGKEDGEWRKYYPNKTLKEKRYFTNGFKTGELFARWENGNKKLQYLFVAGEYTGTCREWNENGLLVKQMNYLSGHEEGAQQWWYDNGKIKANYIIKDGRRFGLLGTKNCINVSDSIFKN
jgi:antitoxin component YwqK of YwqJK toxin-antitoxin module